jgi:MFS family permease
MKTCALYGFISALAGAFLTLIEFFLGWHSDAAKLGLANWVGGIGGLAIYIVCITLGAKARRDETPAAEGFGYGRALLAGLGVALFSTLISTAFNYCYNAFINPAMTDLMLQDRLAKMEASGMSGDKLDKAEAMTRMMFNPIPLAIYFVIVGMVFGLIISLIVAAFVKREAALPPRI